MFCDEALDAVEAIAAGELTPNDRVAQHLASCRQCAAALETARTVERLLQSRDTPRPPPNFTSRTMTRIRRARWRSDQVVDFAFNLALALIVAGLVGAAWIALSQAGVTSVGGTTWDLPALGMRQLVGRVAPSLPLYAAATVVVAAALALWWWAERGGTT